MSVVPTVAIEQIKSAVGPRGWIDHPVDMAPYLTDQRELFHGKAPLVVRPASTAEVAAVVRVCAEHGIGVVPQGGNTGYMGGSVPTAAGDEIVLSLARMNRIRVVDAANYTMTVDAGCVLQDVQQAAQAERRLFPLSLGAEGSCHIGGNLSTNAGGTAVLRYGNARDLVLGLEAVLPDGEIWDGLRALRKDNTGYDLKQLFLGAEGSLGIITGAVLKLFPVPGQVSTAMVAVRDPEAALTLLDRLREASGDGVTTFEYIHGGCLELVLEHVEGTVDPLGERHVHYALVALSGGGLGGGLQDVLEEALASAYEDGLVLDATIAASEAQTQLLWRLRESIPEAQRHAGASIKHDISVPVSRIPELLARGTAVMHETIPDARVISFGHMGDGNVHFNMSQGAGADAAAFLAREAVLTPRMYALVAELDGSFSAEHGIGRYKREELRQYRSATELRLMRAVKEALDPTGIMNPGTVL